MNTLFTARPDKYSRSAVASCRAGLMLLCACVIVVPSLVRAGAEEVFIAGPSPITVIDSEDFGDMSVMSIEDLIKLDTSSLGRNALSGGINGGTQPGAQINIRGVGSDKVPWLLNGRTTFYGTYQIDGDDSDNNLAGLSMDVIERVEILRGPQASLFSSQTAAAVLNILTKEGYETFRPGQSNTYHDIYGQLNRKMFVATQAMGYCDATSGVFRPFWSLRPDLGLELGPAIDGDTWNYMPYSEGFKVGGFDSFGIQPKDRLRVELRGNYLYNFGETVDPDPDSTFTREERWRLYINPPKTGIDTTDYAEFFEGGPDDPNDYGGYFFFTWISMTKEEREEFDKAADAFLPGLSSVLDPPNSGTTTPDPVAPGGDGDTTTPDPVTPAADGDTNGATATAPIPHESLPEPFKGFPYPPDYLLDDPNDCTEEQKAKALALIRARDQGRADHSYWSDLMMNPYLDARTSDEYAQNASDARDVRDTKNEELKKLLLDCGKPATQTASTNATGGDATTPSTGTTTPRRFDWVEFEVLKAKLGLPSDVPNVQLDLEPGQPSDRGPRVRYDTPTFAGFTLSSSWGEPEDNYAVALRYANEFGGIRIANTGGQRDTETGASEGLSLEYTNDLGKARLRIPYGAYINVPNADSNQVEAESDEPKIKYNLNMGFDFDTGTIKVRIPYQQVESDNIEFEGQDFWDSVNDGKELRLYYTFGDSQHAVVIDGYTINGNLNVAVERPQDAKLNMEWLSSQPGFVGVENNQCGDKAVSMMSASTLRTLMAAQAAGAGLSPDDPQWALERVGFTQTDPAWDLVSPGAEPIIVGLIDTGLDWDHLDLSHGNIWKNDGEIPDNGIDDDGNGYIDDIIGWNFVNQDNFPWDNDGHGTFIAGLIVADPDNDVGFRGINPNAKIMVLKALNNFGRTRASYVARAIVYGADNGAKILNLSLTGQGLPRVVQQAIDYANQKGVLVVVAAGNTGGSIDEWYSAGMNNVLPVAATDQSDNRASFSNAGDEISVSAPGLDIQSLRARRTDFMYNSHDTPYQKESGFVGTDNRYYRSAGTSFSTAIVTGVASLVWSDRPELNAEQVRRILEQTADDVEVPGHDRFTGFGIVDAKAALGADENFFIETRVSEMVQQGSGDNSYAEVKGTANADQFARAWLELGAGESPTAWKKVGDELGAPVEAGVVGRIPGSELQGQSAWTVRLIVAHQNGEQRENRFTIAVSETP